MKMMSKDHNTIFMLCVFVMILSFVIQALGNTRIPEFKNFGILSAILMSLVLLFDFLGENMVKKK